MNGSFRDWLLFGCVLGAAFVVGSVVFGSVAEILRTCSMARCTQVERYILPDPGAGVGVAAITASVLLLIALGRRSRPRKV